jgi:hypothetical protein
VLREIQGRHTGENLAPIVLDILQEYSITHKLGYIQMDNATNNDTLIAALSSGTSFPYTTLITSYNSSLYTNLSTNQHFPMIITLPNIKYTALAISLTL